VWYVAFFRFPSVYQFELTRPFFFFFFSPNPFALPFGLFWFQVILPKTPKARFSIGDSTPSFAQTLPHTFIFYNQTVFLVPSSVPSYSRFSLWTPPKLNFPFAPVRLKLSPWLGLPFPSIPLLALSFFFFFSKAVETPPRLP